MRDDVHDTALAAGLLRYCPICDAYELTDQPLAVLGTGERAVREAEFLRGYTADVTVIAPEGSHDLSASQRRRLHAASVVVLEGPCVDFDLRADRIDILLPDGRRSFASVYPALGSDARSEHAVSLGAKVSEEGGIIVDSHQRTSVPGLYAAGDVVLGLDQISHAMGGGGIAATTVRNDLAAARPLRR
jgi:thioredoxin reductase (NADPH)